MCRLAHILRQFNTHRNDTVAQPGYQLCFRLSRAGLADIATSPGPFCFAGGSYIIIRGMIPRDM